MYWVPFLTVKRTVAPGTSSSKFMSDIWFSTDSVQRPPGPATSGFHAPRYGVAIRWATTREIEVLNLMFLSSGRVCHTWVAIWHF